MDVNNSHADSKFTLGVGLEFLLIMSQCLNQKSVDEDVEAKSLFISLTTGFHICSVNEFLCVLPQSAACV